MSVFWKQFWALFGIWELSYRSSWHDESYGSLRPVFLKIMHTKMYEVYVYRNFDLNATAEVVLFFCENVFFYEFHKSAKRSHFENAISYYTKRGVVHIKTQINLLAFYNTVHYRPRPRASVKLQIFESVLKKNIFNKTRQIIFLARRPPKRHKYDEYTFFKKKIPGITMKATTKVHFLNQIIIL